MAETTALASSETVDVFRSFTPAVAFSGVLRCILLTQAASQDDGFKKGRPCSQLH